MKKAAYVTTLDNNRVQCTLCPHQCIINDCRQGLCLTRVNRSGVLYADNYCRPVSTAIDPIEKKPLYHFHPGSAIFSTGPNGCNLKCSFCQNYEISQSVLSLREFTPKELVKKVQRSNTIGIAYTYTEPYIWFETIMAIGESIRNLDLVNVMISNGYMEPQPLAELLEVVDAMNIDIKAMDDDFYKRLCKGTLAPVLRTCETVKKKIHLEITNLLVTGENDSDEAIEKLAKYIASNLGKDTPLHLSRYFPRYKLKSDPTEEEFMLRAWEIARDSLDYVYVGNMMTSDKANTYCPTCNTLLIERKGYSTQIMDNLASEQSTAGNCLSCGNSIAITL